MLSARRAVDLGGSMPVLIDTEKLGIKCKNTKNRLAISKATLNLQRPPQLPEVLNRRQTCQLNLEQSTPTTAIHHGVLTTAAAPAPLAHPPTSHLDDSIPFHDSPPARVSYLETSATLCLPLLPLILPRLIQNPRRPSTSTNHTLLPSALAASPTHPRANRPPNRRGARIRPPSGAAAARATKGGRCRRGAEEGGGQEGVCAAVQDGGTEVGVGDYCAADCVGDELVSF